MFQVLDKVTGGKPCATLRSYGGRWVILKALNWPKVQMYCVPFNNVTILISLAYKGKRPMCLVKPFF